MSYKPLVINAGQMGQLPAGEALDAGGWTLPVAGGTLGYVLTADASGNAIWQAATPPTSSYPDPTDDDQVLISTAVDAASWVTAGSNQVLASNVGGDLQFEAKPFAWNIASPSASGYALVSSGAGTAGWYETMLTNLLVQAPSAGDEGKALTVDGTGKAVTVATTLTDLITSSAPSPTLENKVVQADAAGRLQLIDPAFGFGLAGPAAAEQILVSSAASAAAWQTPGVDKVVTSNGSGALTFADKPFGYNLASPTVVDQTLVSTASGAASWQTLGINKIYTTDEAGTVSFDTKPPAWDWLNPADAGRVFVSTGADVTSWQINTFKDVQTSPLVDNAGKILNADASGYAQWTTDIALTALEIKTVTGGVVQVSTSDTAFGATEVAGSFQYYTSDGSTNGAGVCAALRYVCDGTWNGATNIGHWGVYVQDSASAAGTLVERLRVHNDGDVEVVAGALTMTAGPVKLTKGSGASYHDGIQLYGTTGTPTGTMVIDLPGDFDVAMVAIRIRGYTYQSYEGPWEVLIGGYAYNPSSDKKWVNHHASVQGEPPFTQIRMGYNGNTSKACIMLGDTTTYWRYPQILVQDILVGYTSTVYSGDWAISITTNETNFYNNDPTYADPEDVSWNRDYPAPTVANRALISTGAQVATWQTTKVSLTANKTLYVATTGNDTTGDGTSGTPFATVDRAIEEIELFNIGDNTVTVDIGTGQYTHTARIKFQHPEGGKVTFDGDAETVTSQSTTSIGATEYNLTTVSGDLDYVEATITLTGKTLAVGDYILIYNASSGTNPKALQGCHKIESWASDVATIRIVYKAGVGLPSGTINFDCKLIRTVLNFTGSNGIEANGPYHLGTWTGLVIAGNPNNADCDYGIWLDNAAAIILSSSTGVRGWMLGILARYNATVNANSAFVSCCLTYGMEAVNGAAIVCQDALISGCNNSSLYAYIGGTINANGANITGSGANGVRASDGAAIYFDNGVIKHSTNDVLYALVGSTIRAEAEDVSVTQVYYDSTATCSPVKDTVGNYGAAMVGGPY